MKKIHTHYDNLKVARNAPPEVIRAAYKSLSQKFHPDRNPGNAESTRIMAIINNSYDVLSDQEKRRQHDEWITQQENASAGPATVNNQPRQTHPQSRQPTRAAAVLAHVLKNWILYCIAFFFIWIWATDRPTTPPPGPKPYQATPPPVRRDMKAADYLDAPDDYRATTSLARREYIRPNAAPNGQPWPVSAGYVKGYQRLHADGLSTVTVDNSQNNSDVFVKLVSLDGAQAYPVRQFYIPAFNSFALKKVTPGNYDIRYRDLSNGGLSRSEAFSVKETPTSDGIRYSNTTMTLYKVQHGNMQTYGLSEGEF